MAATFQALTIRANGRLNRIVTDIEVTPAFDPAAPPTPVPVRLRTKALWDTGASRSVLSIESVNALGLSPVGTVQVHHGDGTSSRSTYLVNFYLPNNVGIVGVLASEFPASHTEFAVLLGMDVIGLGDFSITNVGGQTCMSFRTPSCEHIDYVAQANRLAYAGVGRNDACPCGSGEKFKRCHGR
jgi:hypothetical protein